MSENPESVAANGGIIDGVAIVAQDTPIKKWHYGVIFSEDDDDDYLKYGYDKMTLDGLKKKIATDKDENAETYFETRELLRYDGLIQPHNCPVPEDFDFSDNEKYRYRKLDKPNDETLDNECIQKENKDGKMCNFHYFQVFYKPNEDASQGSEEKQEDPVSEKLAWKNV
ncbi:hypothetical protein COEREDRAFT_89714 [Coemansia reversa NRRL 1564]|uniref:Uncharacterized protein n=1 Tax=Coemansia reversa (strain ATCC 12441 / NRRL 1564) TaxID=763665 RepID=A0A2G5B2L5_COERN|nr:hypothetical protein COEREDRAFT_89714 [Coemansia reversa NRRL 1564]|eukprot:PIA13258.1 hypothetical protein COEREDRAFT_89714 [Coemansia reversa NRRL 1564]